jgi:hypothetical protein
MKRSMFTIEEGRLRRDGEPFTVVGVNFHPSAAGCDYWRDWSEAAVAEALTAMAASGVNVVRFFLFWRDFEPAPGRYEEAVLTRLVRFVELAGQRGIACLPSLLTIWMNGQLFDLEWRRGRDLWTDAEMRARAAAYVRVVARRLRDRPNVVAYDLGDELPQVAPAAAMELSAPAVRAWVAELAAAILAEHPGALVCQANDAGAAFGSHLFRPEDTAPTGLVALHGFPVWTPIEAESWLAYKSTLLASFLTRFGARAGAVVLDELGCYGADEETTARYLDAALHAQLANGGAGAAVWCWQDFATARKPFELRPQERRVGLLDERGREKPALGVLRAFAAEAATLSGLRPEPSPVAILARELRDELPGGYLRQPLDSTVGRFYAFALAKRAQLPCELVAEPGPRHRLLLAPSLHGLRQSDLDRLRRFVEQGGHLYASLGDYLHGFLGEELLGVRLVDFARREGHEATFEFRGVRYPARQRGAGEPAVTAAVVAPLGAEVLASFADGSPALTRWACGRGQVVFLNAPFEEALNRPGLLEAGPWHELYRWLAREAGVEPRLASDVPDVECAVLTGPGRAVGILVNHSPQRQCVRPVLAGDEGPVALPAIELEAKATRVLLLPDRKPSLSGGSG